MESTGPFEIWRKRIEKGFSVSTAYYKYDIITRRIQNGSIFHGPESERSNPTGESTIVCMDSATSSKGLCGFNTRCLLQSNKK